MFFKIFGKLTALLFEMNKENSVKYSLTQTKTLPTPFVNVATIKLKFGIPYLMGMPEGLFALFYLLDF